MNTWKFDTDKTKERYIALWNFYRDRGLNADGTFSCKHWPRCLEFKRPGTVLQYSGGTAGLTPFYDLWYRGQPLRVLIVGKECSYNSGLKYGVAPNVNARSWQCLYTIESRTRTNHIKGTLLTLQWIFEVESDYLYACYALSNILRCGFQRQESAENTSDLQHTPIMLSNCSEYLVREIEILEPTLVITQGAWAVDSRPSLIDRLRLTLEAEGKCLLRNKSNDKYGLYEFPGFRLITSHHPARLGVWNSQYAEDSLRPMINSLKADGYLPRIVPEDADQFERLVKPPVDKMLAQMPAEYRF